MAKKVRRYLSRGQPWSDRALVLYDLTVLMAAHDPRGTIESVTGPKQHPPAQHPQVALPKHPEIKVTERDTQAVPSLRELRDIIRAEPLRASWSYHRRGDLTLGLVPKRGPLTSISRTYLTDAFSKAGVTRLGTPVLFRGLRCLDEGLALEVVNVSLAICEQYPGITLGGIFVENLDDPLDEPEPAKSLAERGGTMASSFGGSQAYRIVHEFAIKHDVSSLAEFYRDDLEHARAALPDGLLDLVGWICPDSFDFRSNGLIVVGRETFGTRTTYLEICVSQEARRRRHALRNLHPIPALRTTLTTAVLLHEFGHLVAGTLRLLPGGVWESTLDVLERALFGDNDGFQAHRAALINAGASPQQLRLGGLPDGKPGAYSDAQEALPAQKDLFGEPVQNLMDLAPRWSTSVDEIFAESFALSLSAQSGEVRSRLRPFRQSLIDAGIARG